MASFSCIIENKDNLDLSLDKKIPNLRVKCNVA